LLLSKIYAKKRNSVRGQLSQSVGPMITPPDALRTNSGDSKGVGAL
jgi:hypothetical protein